MAHPACVRQVLLIELEDVPEPGAALDVAVEYGTAITGNYSLLLLDTRKRHSVALLPSTFPLHTLVSITTLDPEIAGLADARESSGWQHQLRGGPFASDLIFFDFNQSATGYIFLNIHVFE